MNERIRQLAEQCESFGSWDNKTYSFDKEKFAELIVQECISISEQYDKGLSENDVECFTCRKVAYTISDRIQKHFGVEE